MRKAALIVVVLLLVVAVVPAAAKTKPLGVNIVAPMTIFPGEGTFSATGPAVDAGVVCASGEVTNRFGSLHAPPPPLRTLSVIHEFSCNEAPFGSFYLKLEVKFTEDGTTANWVVHNGTPANGEIDGDMDGTGAYTELRGRGKLVGFPQSDNQVLDVYSGQLH